MRDSYSPLQSASIKGDVDLCKELLDSKSSDLDVEMNSGNSFEIGNVFQTPFQYAVQKNHLSLVKFFLERKVNPNRLNLYDSAIQQATLKGNLSIVKVLMVYGADLNATTTCPTRETYSPIALEIAAGQGNKELFDLLLSQYSKLDDTIQHYGYRIVQAAVHANNQGIKETDVIIHRLLEKGFLDPLLELEDNVCLSQIHYNKSPLQLAASAGNHEIVDLLLKRVGRPDQYHFSFPTPLQLAVLGKHHKVIALLVNNQANPDLAGENCQETPLQIAVKNNDIKAVELLLNAQANPALDARIQWELAQIKKHSLSII